MKSAEIRESFLDFFAQRGHKVMSSSPLVLPWDPTVLFTTAGMQQFKPYFEGRRQPPARRLTSVQKCFRTSDVDTVGDASHLTFFEMLGNFSIGDYFKEEAVAWAWEYVTQVMRLPPERLWAAIFLDDDEAFDLWRKQGVPNERIRRYGEEDNYWFAGQVGPCGPCSEIYFDFGPERGCRQPDCEPVHDCGRFLEIWNLVFMTFYQHPDGSRTPLPAKNIDTGAGLERMAAVLLFLDGRQGNQPPSAYDTDLFRPIIRSIEELSGRRYRQDEATDRAMRIVAEHARAATFLIGDEQNPTAPSNEERGYAVRRIIRRAVYYGMLLGRGIAETKVGQDKGPIHILDRGTRRVCLTQIVPHIITKMGSTYPELISQQDFIQKLISAEEENFYRTLTSGEQLLRGTLVFRSGAIDVAKDPHSLRVYLDNIPSKFVDEVVLPVIKPYIERGQSPPTELTANEVFVLYDTYGFPVELTREIARERGFTIDEKGFQRLMEEQRGRARAAARGGEHAAAPAYASLGDMETPFVGYETLRTESAVLALPANGQLVEAAPENEAVEVILRETPFYPEGGGQVGDRGEIVGHTGRAVVEDAQRVAEKLIVHRGRVVEGSIAVGDTVVAQVDPQRRADVTRNHTGTHLLHTALRQALGTHVRQSGSLVAPDRLRFDFTHPEAPTQEDLARVQTLVNEKVRANLPVQTHHTSFDKAVGEGVLAFFGEAYGDQVRVVEVPDVPSTGSGRFSAELCGGTHCQRTGDIGFLLIVAENSIGAGLRRIEALTGRGAEEYVSLQAASLDEVSRRLGAPRETLAAKLDTLMGEQEAVRKRLERLEQALAQGGAAARRPVKKATVDGISVRAEKVQTTSERALRFIGDAAKKELGAGATVFGAIIEGKPMFLAIAAPEAIKRGVRADTLVRAVARLAGGSGGGRPDMAQGGGKDPSKVARALAKVPDLVQEMLTES
jgi:alanyl-tRNA synthetase